MARVKNTMQLIDEYMNHANAKYDICSDNIQDIHDTSNNIYDLILNGFRFGYMQGMKAAKAERQEGTGQRTHYIKKIFKILSCADLWTLNQIYQFAISMTKEVKNS